MSIKFNLDDIRDYERDYPQNFRAFSDIDALEPHDLVKLIFRFEDDESDFAQVERMWVVVIRREGDELVGTLDNEPYTKGCLNLGDEIKFKIYNVFEIYEN